MLQSGGCSCACEFVLAQSPGQVGMRSPRCMVLWTCTCALAHRRHPWAAMHRVAAGWLACFALPLPADSLAFGLARASTLQVHPGSLPCRIAVPLHPAV